MLKGYRTFAVAGVLAVLGALETLQWTDILSEQTAGLVVVGIAALMAAFRTFTTTKPGASE